MSAFVEGEFLPDYQPSPTIWGAAECSLCGALVVQETEGKHTRWHIDRGTKLKALWNYLEGMAALGAERQKR